VSEYFLVNTLYAVSLRSGGEGQDFPLPASFNPICSSCLNGAFVIRHGAMVPQSGAI